ncbi:8448_t:CDS:2, partial [Gigaspora margarita]
NVHIPYSSQQEGATYFKSLYKVEIFDVCEEGVPRQVSSIPKTENGELILPDVIILCGLSLDRQWYLHDEIAQHIQNPEK